MDLPAQVVSKDDQREIQEASLSHQIPRKPFDKHIHETVYLEVEERLRAREQLPGYSSWSKNMRLYTLLRMLGYQDGDQVFQKFENEKIGDFWLPLTTHVWKQLASGPGFDLLKLMDAQRHVMSDSKQMDEHNLLVPFFEQRYIPGSRARSHRYLEYARSHFEDLDEIGRGSSACVIHVRHKFSGKEFACKRFPRMKHISRQRDQLKVFEQEVKILQSIRHHHIVGLVASFTDLESFSLILDPIADITLSKMLKQDKSLSDKDIATLRCSFNCLATALTFLHANSVRHKDIKPSNILLSEGRVLLCDFGISLEWTEGDNGTTEGCYPSFTRRYAAPEVLRSDASRNSKTDVWSLGCVFLEIASAIKGISFDDINVGECVEGKGLSSAAMGDWLMSIRNEHEDAIDELPIGWTLAMVMHDAHDRPAASHVVSRIHESTRKHGLTGKFLASCCRRSGFDSLSGSSICSARTSIPSSESHAHTDFAAPPRDVSIPRSYRHQPSTSQRSEGVSIPGRSSSNRSTPIRLSRSQVRQNSGGGVSISNNAILSSARTSTTTPRTSLGSDSAYYETPVISGLAIEGYSDIAVLAAPALIHGSSSVCGIRDHEKHLFEEPCASFTMRESATIQKSSHCCNNLENIVQVFETPRASMNGRRSLTSPVWKVTRRLVLSNTTPHNPRCCYSFWLPLTDIRFSLCETTVTLQWSDCNQPQQGSTYDHREYWSWVYDPVRPNNQITVVFNDMVNARAFLDVIHLSQDDGSTLDISSSQKVRILDGMRPDNKEGVIGLTLHEETFSELKLVVVGQHIDFRMERSLDNRSFDVRLNNVSKPTYHSDLIHNSARSRNRAARFSEALLIPTSVAVSALLAADSESPVPPPSIATMFYGLTGWRLQFFASVKQVKSEKHALSMSKKRYGVADVMLWRKDVEDTVLARIAIRPSGEGSVWISGRISASSSVFSSSKDASCWFDIFGKQHGRLLDVFNMAAVSELAQDDPSSVDPTFGFQYESRRITLHIQDRKHRQKFTEVFEELIHATANSPPASNAIGTLVTRPRHVLPTPLA